MSSRFRRKTFNGFMGALAVIIALISSTPQARSFFSVPQLPLDSAWITGTMKQAGYDNLIIFYCEIDSVRESSNQTTPEFFVHFLMEQGVTRNIAGTGIKHPKKFIAKSRRFRFIPGIAAYSIIFYFR